MVDRLKAIASASTDARAQIIDVISAVTLHLDLQEFAAAKGLFTPDATFCYQSLFDGDSTPIPADQFWQHVLSFLPGLDRGFHQTTNFDIHVAGDTATSRSMVFACHRLDNEFWEQGGLYEHELVELPEGWRIRKQNYTKFWERGRDLVRAGAARLAARAKG